MDHYPKVVNELTTLMQVTAGKSITRFGDGEFRLAMGGEKNISQVNHPALKKELVNILRLPQKFCLVAIPDMNPESPKWWFWKKYERKYPKMLNEGMLYYSQFITRPDSAPSIDTPEFYDRMQTLWANKEVTLVRGSERSLVEGRGPMLLAKKVHTVICPYRDAYDQIDVIEKQVKKIGVPTVVLCAGAMATALTYRLARQNFHAIDLGHIGFLWRNYERRRSAHERIQAAVAAKAPD